MAEDDAEPRHPLKRFRGDYGQSADEERQSNPLEDEVEPVNKHRFPHQPTDTDQIYFPEAGSTTRYSLRFPDDGADEGYLVLRSPEEEETVKSKPRGATAKRRPSETTSTTTDNSSSDAGVTVGSQSKRRRRTSKRSRTPNPNNGTGDDDTGSETSVIVKSSAVNPVEAQSINSRMCCTGRVSHSCFCSGVSRYLKIKHRDPIPLRITGTQRLPSCGVKVSNYLLYCRGLEEDFNNHYGTLTATVSFLTNSCFGRQLLQFYNCTVKIVVETFEGSVECGRKLNTATEERQLKSAERTCHSMHITVHKVVNLDDIVYSTTCPDEIFFRITVDLDAKSMFSVSESGMDDFLEVSLSSV